MSYNRFDTVQSSAQPRAIDPGLQAFMRSVYNTMGLGLLLTGGTAYALSQIPGIRETLYTSGWFYIAAFAPLVFLMFGFTHSRIVRMSASQLTIMFSAFAATMGVSMGSIFLVYSSADIARAFFVTAGTFAGMSLYGYTTKRDLSAFRSFLVMGLIGLFIASIVNIFLGSGLMQFVISAAGVLVFTGLTAWETQNLRLTYAETHGREANSKIAVMGALGLYLNFVNLFQMILHLMSNRE
jgi:FtsH-binding integral membrane protein